MDGGGGREVQTGDKSDGSQRMWLGKILIPLILCFKIQLCVKNLSDCLGRVDFEKGRAFMKELTSMCNIKNCAKLVPCIVSLFFNSLYFLEQF